MTNGKRKSSKRWHNDTNKRQRVSGPGTAIKHKVGPGRR